MFPRIVLRRLALALGLLVGAGFAVPETLAAPPAESADSVSCKKKKRSRRAKKRRARRRAKKRRVTARTIKRWQKRGWSDEKIVKQARKLGYRVTKKERRRLKRYKVRKSLRAALAAPPKPEKTGPRPIDTETVIDPNDIDFDSVAPPKGMDMDFADAHRAERGG